MKRVLFAGLLSLISGAASAATIITVDGNVLFTTSPSVSFDTSQNVLVIQSNENLTCSGGPAVVPGLSTLSVQIDGNDIYELQSEITIERVNGDTLVQMTTMSSDTLCNFVDEIFADGFEAPVAQSPFTSS